MTTKSLLFPADSVEQALSSIHLRYHGGGGTFLPVSRAARLRVLPRNLKTDARSLALLVPAISSAEQGRGEGKDEDESNSSQSGEEESNLTPEEREEAESVLYEQVKMLWGFVLPLSAALESPEDVRSEALEILQSIILESIWTFNVRRAKLQSVASSSSSTSSSPSLQVSHARCISAEWPAAPSPPQSPENAKGILRPPSLASSNSSDSLDGEGMMATPRSVKFHQNDEPVSPMRPTKKGGSEITPSTSPRSSVSSSPGRNVVTLSSSRLVSSSSSPSLVIDAATPDASPSSSLLPPSSSTGETNQTVEGGEFPKRGVQRTISDKKMMAGKKRLSIGRCRSWFTPVGVNKTRKGGEAVLPIDESLRIEQAKQQVLDSSPKRYLQPLRCDIASRVHDRSEDDFVSIWTATEQGGGLVLRDPKPGEVLTRFSVRLGTLNKLVELATTPVNPLVGEELSTSQSYLSIFILTYRSFVSPDILLRKLTDRFNVPQPLIEQSADPQRAAAEATAIRRSVCVFVRLWFRLAYSTFDPDSAALLYAFVASASQYAAGLSREDKLWANIRLLEKTIEKKFQDPSFILTPAARRAPPQSPPPCLLPPEPIVWSQLAFLDVSSLEFARQLTVVDFHIYADIQPCEFFNLAWSKPALQHCAPNISLFISRFNLVSAIASGLILSGETPQQRALAYQKLVEIALILRSLGNYHSLMAVVGAFSNAGVKRLSSTISLIPQRISSSLTDLRDLMSPFQSFKNYRLEYGAARGPCIPFIGIFLTDLTYIEDGNRNDIDGMINFYKRAASYTIIQDVLRFKGVPYDLRSHPQLQAFIARLPRFTDEELYERSLEYEPRITCSVSSSLSSSGTAIRERNRRLELPFSAPSLSLPSTPSPNQRSSSENT